MEKQEKQIVHEWKEAEKSCAIYDDLTLVTGSERKLLTSITAATISFVANGRRYFIEDTLSIERWVFSQQLSIETGFGVEFDEMLKAWQNQYELLNKQKFADCVVQAYNIINGITKVFQRTPTILKFCALFINAEDEDRGTITEDVIKRKVDDWTVEGLSIDGFFEFSLLKVRGLAEGYLKTMESVSGLMESISTENQLTADRLNEAK